MNIFTNLRMKLNNLFKENGGYILVYAVIIFFLLNFNQLFKNLNVNTKPITIGSNNTAILEGEETFPTKITEEGKKKIEEFLEYCNNKEYDKAYEMISDDCKNNEFKNKEEAIGYMIRIFPYNRKYEIQAYMKRQNYYIYQVKIFDDFLKTGLTKARYEYDDEKITIVDSKEGLKLNIRGYVKTENANGMYENNNLKIEALKRHFGFMNESYTIKVTNRSDKTLILNDSGKNRNGQIYMHIGEDVRKIENNDSIIIEPFATKEYKIVFPRLFDPDKRATDIEFAEVRFSKDYNVENENYDEKYSVKLLLNNKK